MYERVFVCRGRMECELGSWRQLDPVNKPTGILSEGTRETRRESLQLISF